MELNFERLAMIAALVAMAGAIVAKMVTMQLIKVMRKTIEVVNQSRLEAVRQLNKAQSKKMSPAASSSSSKTSARRSAPRSASSKENCPNSKKPSPNGRNNARRCAAK